MSPEKVQKLAETYASLTAENLSRIIRIPSFSGEEEGVIRELEQLCRAFEFDEVRIDGLGSLLPG